MTCLISGATGEIGSRVVELIIRNGDRPRVFVRDSQKAKERFGNDVDIFVGDLAVSKSLVSALTGTKTLFLINTGQDIATRDREAAQVAKALGVKHLVKLSSLDSRLAFGTGVWHAKGESAIRASGIDFTFIQPSGFMSNALFWAESIKNESVVRSCAGEGKIAFIHPDDIAAVATKVIMTGDYHGESLPITGPKAQSYSEMTAEIGAAIKKPLTFESISEDQERQKLTKDGAQESEIEYHLSIYRAIREGRAEIVTGEVERVLGRRPIAFGQWAQDNVASFI
ncbi:MAG TPA: NAD(P)H-binding protein [Candidatus Bathyarchaeia archaeon]|nr:NAD(P)H-binding protein [Candidatus Bathyarchaeia archaeon]